MLYNICLLYENVATYYSYDIFDLSRVTVWLIGLNKEQQQQQQQFNNSMIALCICDKP